MMVRNASCLYACIMVSLYFAQEAGVIVQTPTLEAHVHMANMQLNRRDYSDLALKRAKWPVDLGALGRRTIETSSIEL